ncbi:hypothetical protein QF026_008507 [Streptomyces aurantiacus]|nr:hypothetical protein [Streptomyces aurantiacus]
MMPRPINVPAPRRARSAFAGVDVCDVAGLRLAPGVRQVIFDQDRWRMELADAHRPRCPDVMPEGGAWRTFSHGSKAALTRGRRDAKICTG